MELERPHLTRRRALLAALALLATALACATLPAEGGGTAVEPLVIRVNAHGQDPGVTLQQAVAGAPKGASVYLDPGTYWLRSPLEIVRSVHLVGSGSGTTVVALRGSGHVVGFSGNGEVTVRDITFRHEGFAEADVLVSNGGRVQLTGCRLAGARAGPLRGGSPTLGLPGVELGAGARLAGNTVATVNDCEVGENELAGILVQDTAHVAGNVVENAKSDIVYQGPGGGPTDRAELASVVDPVINKAMFNLSVPGAVFALVKDGRLFYAKGYGYADIEASHLMHPNRTLLRVASISKLFTATAVMQLHERGLVHLDDNVNDYLVDFQLDDTYRRPITVADLLTHTAGFDEESIGLASADPLTAPPLGAFLASHVPARVAPPGSTYGYSNYGMGLAGYVVERVSRESFADYAEANILRPLGMRSSTFAPLSHREPDLARGYEWDGDSYGRVADSYMNLAPSGQLIGTAADMARFMIAQLQEGRLGDAQILRAGTAQQMQRQQFTLHPQLPGTAYGFYERFQNNQRGIEHAGDWGGFASLMLLLPDSDIGIFVCANADQPAFREAVVDALLDRYFPVAQRVGAPAPRADFATRGEIFTGSYRSNRVSQATLEKAYALAPEKEIYVDPEDDGGLRIGGGRYVEVEPLLFRSLYGDGYAAFRQDGDGHIAQMFVGNSVYARLPWYDSAWFHRPLAVLLGVAFASALVAWPVAALVAPLLRRRKRATWPRRFVPPGPRKVRPPWWLAAAVSALDLTFLIGILLAFDGYDLRFGVPGPMKALLVLPLIATGLTCALPVFSVLAWRERYWRWWQRAHYSLITVAAVLFVWFTNYWNLWGFHY